MSKYSCLLGHLCGDAAGATLEFYKRKIDDEKANKAMHMPGGGCLNVGPGQITDDGELTLDLFHALANVNIGFPLNKVAKKYAEWYKSEPFDCGMTCARAFGNYTNDENIGTAMIHNAIKSNIISQANGALMRACPIAIWGLSHTDHQIATAAKLDAMLSHPNIICQDANAIYCITLANIIRGNNMDCVDTHIEFNEYSPTVVKWYREAKEIRNFLEYFKDCQMNIGHVKHAFTMAMYFAWNKEISYEQGIRDVLKCGGDTDTNAAICGAILGALHGIGGEKGIPEYMYKPVLEFDCENFDIRKHLMGHKRPSIYNVKHIRGLFGI